MCGCGEKNRKIANKGRITNSENKPRSIKVAYAGEREIKGGKEYEGTVILTYNDGSEAKLDYHSRILGDINTEAEIFHEMKLPQGITKTKVRTKLLDIVDGKPVTHIKGVIVMPDGTARKIDVSRVLVPPGQLRETAQVSSSSLECEVCKFIVRALCGFAFPISCTAACARVCLPLIWDPPAYLICVAICYVICRQLTRELCGLPAEEVCEQLGYCP